jgi:hypothetical protein
MSIHVSHLSISTRKGLRARGRGGRHSDTTITSVLAAAGNRGTSRRRLRLGGRCRFWRRAASPETELVQRLRQLLPIPKASSAESQTWSGSVPRSRRSSSKMNCARDVSDTRNAKFRLNTVIVSGCSSPLADAAARLARAAARAARVSRFLIWRGDRVDAGSAALGVRPPWRLQRVRVRTAGRRQ